MAHPSSNVLSIIQPHQQGAISTFPSYVYGVGERALPQAKETAQTITKDALLKLGQVKRTPANVLGRSYDWIYGLTSLEEGYLKKGFALTDLTFDRIVEIHDLFERTRLWWHQASSKEAEFLDVSDRFFSSFFQGIVNETWEEIHYDFDVPTLVPVDEVSRRLNIFATTRPLMTDKNGHYFMPDDARAKLEEIKKEHSISLKDALAQYPREEICFVNQCKANEVLINIDSFLETLTKKAEDQGPDAAKPLYERELEAVAVPSLHPIEKACRIWFFFLKHPISPLGSPLVAKAIGSMILLKHGYLPPVIDESYAKCVQDTLDHAQGLKTFTDFIARAVMTVQNS